VSGPRPASLALPLVLPLLACSLRPAPRPPQAHFDFGLPETADERPPRIHATVVVPDPVAPAWIDSLDIHYRLAYDDGTQLRRYANSRWALSPVHLLSALLRGHLAAATERGAAVRDYGLESDYWLRLEIEEFSQVFDTPAASRGVVRVRVALIERRGRRLVAQRMFGAESPASASDARAGAAALAAASEGLVEQLVDWIAASLPAAAPGDPRP